MQETAIDDPGLPDAPEGAESAADAAEPAAAEPPELAFTDAASATRWVKSLPLSTIGQAYQEILGQLHALTASQIGPRDRATIAELIREPVAHLHAELARRYAGKPQPPDERESEAADQAIALWQALWIQYSVCLKPLLEGSTELQGVKAKLLQRALYVGKQLIIVHGFARRIPSEELWQELHAYYRLAEMLDCAMVAVSDHLMPEAEGLSCYSTYSHALLLALADPYALGVRHIELVDRWLGQWARKVFPYAKQRENEGPVIIVDLEGPHGAVLAGGGITGVLPPSGVGALRLPGKARDERARAPQATRERQHAGRAAARRRRFDGDGNRAPQASRRALAPRADGCAAQALDGDRDRRGRHGGRVLPRRRTLVQPAGPPRPGRRPYALPADRRRHLRFRPSQGAGRA